MGCSWRATFGSGSQTWPLIMISSAGRPENSPIIAEFAACLTKPVKQSLLYNVLAGLWGDDGVRSHETSPLASEFDELLGQRLPLRVLAAEDHTVNQQLIVRLLRRMGYDADVVSNGVEAVEAVRRQRYDVVLMDVQMPEMDGLEAARLIGEEHGARRPQIIAMTANAMQGDREHGLAVGMDEYVTKPIRISELQAALTAVGQRIHGRPARFHRVALHGRDESPANILDLDQEPILDPAAFDESREFLGNEADEVINGVIEAFQRRTPEMLQAMRQALASGERQKLQLAVHTLKGFSGTVGARRIQTLCAHLEKSADGAGASELLPLLERLDEEFAMACAALPDNEVVAEQSSLTPA